MFRNSFRDTEVGLITVDNTRLHIRLDILERKAHKLGHLDLRAVRVFVNLADRQVGRFLWLQRKSKGVNQSKRTEKSIILTEVGILHVSKN